VEREHNESLARGWIAADPDPVTGAELRRLVEDRSPELAERMAGPPRFGTAGLRAPVRAGPNGMNVAVVRRTSAGLAEWLRAGGHGGGLVVVGRDARRGSPEFADATASVLAAAGFPVAALAAPLPTPVLAFAVRALGAVAGVQITASHNPASDNGYKVYLGGSPHTGPSGAQLVEPADAEIETAIASAPPAAAIPTRPVPGFDPGPLLREYLARTAALPRGPARRLRIALTALHGVGNDVAVAALRLAGFADVRVVAAQAEPDPAFPTVRYPNPEEPGATDLLLRLAAEVDADLAVALDPDADRCALGIPDPDRPGGWRMLTGNETGALLGEHLLRTLDRAAHPDPLVVTTHASSRLLREIAAAHRVRYAETPTGFKWIVRAGPGLVFGFEEALGYCVDPDTVLDKDGIAAAVLAADLAATRRAGGSSLAAALDELAVAHGVHLTETISLAIPAGRPASGRGSVLAGLAGLAGLDRADQRPAPGVYVINGAGTRTVVRRSGTEPKLKAYLEVTEPVAGATALPAARRRATERLRRLRAETLALLDSSGIEVFRA
jgi:phosphomannomutase